MGMNIKYQASQKQIPSASRSEKSCGVRGVWADVDGVWPAEPGVRRGDGRLGL